ncbi:MAG: DUF4105 domain-containing protein [Polyangia bacterium]
MRDVAEIERTARTTFRFVRSCALTAALLLCGAAEADSVPDEKRDRYSVFVVTMGPGDDLFARFGHIALLVDDHRERTRKVYNFGTFDFQNPDLQIKYARGYLEYWLSVHGWAPLVRFYRQRDREVVVRELNLTIEQEREIVRRLEINALPENRAYDYRHYLDNCCTRIRDLLDEAVGGAISAGRDERPTGRTFRDWTRRALEGMPVMSSVILFSLGPAVDRPITRWDEYFLPAVLSEDLDEVRIGPGRRPLVGEAHAVVKRKGPPVGSRVQDWELTVALCVGAALVLGLLLPLAFGRRGAGRRLSGFGLLSWGLLGGLGGLVLVLFCFTEHSDTHYNENMLAWPVTHLWLVGPGLALLFRGRLSRRTARIAGWYLLICLGPIAFDLAIKLGPFIQHNYGPLALAALCDLLALAALVRCGIAPRPWHRPRKSSPQSESSRR